MRGRTEILIFDARRDSRTALLLIPDGDHPLQMCLPNWLSEVCRAWKLGAEAMISIHSTASRTIRNAGLPEY